MELRHCSQTRAAGLRWADKNTNSAVEREEHHDGSAAELNIS